MLYNLSLIYRPAGDLRAGSFDTIHIADRNVTPSMKYHYVLHVISNSD